jgi:hypothetical protein
MLDLHLLIRSACSVISESPDEFGVSINQLCEVGCATSIFSTGENERKKWKPLSSPQFRSSEWRGIPSRTRFAADRALTRGFLEREFFRIGTVCMVISPAYHTYISICVLCQTLVRPRILPATSHSSVWNSSSMTSSLSLSPAIVCTQKKTPPFVISPHHQVWEAEPSVRTKRGEGEGVCAYHVQCGADTVHPRAMDLLATHSQNVQRDIR